MQGIPSFFRRRVRVTRSFSMSPISVSSFAICVSTPFPIPFRNSGMPTFSVPQSSPPPKTWQTKPIKTLANPKHPNERESDEMKWRQTYVSGLVMSAGRGDARYHRGSAGGSASTGDEPPPWERQERHESSWCGLAWILEKKPRKWISINGSG